MATDLLTMMRDANLYRIEITRNGTEMDITFYFDEDVHRPRNYPYSTREFVRPSPMRTKLETIEAHILCDDGEHLARPTPE